MVANTPLEYRYTAAPGRPTVLYLHGFLGCKEDWDDVIARLGDEFGHLAVDLPGHGATGNRPSDQEFTMSGCAELLDDLVIGLGLRRCHVIGYSMGGRLGLYLARIHAHRFGRFVIESSSPGLKSAVERLERTRRDQRLAEMIQRADFEEFLVSWYNQPLFMAVDKRSAAFQNLLDRRLVNSPAGLARSLNFMGTGVQPSLWEELADIKPPLLFVAGGLDAKFQRIATDMANLCPKGQLAILAKAGHTVHLEQPDDYCRQVKAFLSQP
jgi:2-succinyl-6-hydroxy-2,4-cyclohexadiene-1-carboxylate synthase